MLHSDAVSVSVALFCAELPVFMSARQTFHRLHIRHQTSVPVSELEIDPLIQLQMTIFSIAAVWRFFFLLKTWELKAALRLSLLNKPLQAAQLTDEAVGSCSI